MISTQALLKLHDSQIINAVKLQDECGGRAIGELSRWLARQRMTAGDLVSNPLQAKVLADEILMRGREQIAEAVRAAIHRDDLPAQEVARRCGTSRETVVSLLTGNVPSSLELLIKLAVVLGVRVEIDVAAKHQGVARERP